MASHPRWTTQRPWAADSAADSSWVNRYADAATRLKGQPVDPRSLKEAFCTIYRGVALGLDGTLTINNRVDLAPEMAQLVADLLRRGVPVVLVTSRGYSVRDTIEELIEYSHLSSAYLRRLYCLIYNGVILLRHDTRKGEEPLADEERLIDTTEDLADLRQKAESTLRQHAQLPMGKVQLSAGSVRIKYPSEELCREAEPILARELQDFLVAYDLRTSVGAYGKDYCIDIGHGRKAEALDKVSEIIGVPRNTIVCVGDRGDDGGNDYHFLNHIHGFSVNRVSSNQRGCYPVLRTSLDRVLTGPAGVKRLLKLVLLFPPLSLDAGSITPDRMHSLRQVERDALSDAHAAVSRTTAALNESIITFDCMPKWARATGVGVQDIYDPLSGAVRIRDWEINDVDVTEQTARLLQIDKLLSAHTEPRTEFCMYSDSGILLRGPAYYPGWTLNNPKIETLLATIANFARNASLASRDAENRTPTFLRYKLSLSVMDHIRNYLLILASIFFAREGSDSSSYPLTRELINSFSLRHTTLHLQAIHGGKGGWRKFHKTLSVFLDDLYNCMQDADLSQAMEGDATDFISEGSLKPRECDHFIENVTAIHLGLQKHLSGIPSRKLRAVGLAYGGLELPIIAATLGPDLGLNIEPALIRLSLYGNSKISGQIHDTAPGYVEELLGRLRPICLAGKRRNQSVSDRPAILLDDNCTTARTLQWGRDVLMGLGVDVAGSIIVKYPRATRKAQIADNGMPDPEVMFGFIRGLIGPSPYVRLIMAGSNDENRYLDQLGSFDKSKERMLRYLAKNGTPRVN
jgi:hydroxymethylpyrimidine pyrophosphatase-like HAD family hydrolase